MPFSVKPDFLVIFKIGDNINYNLRALRSLYKGYAELPDGKALIKPIVIINTSIAEAILYDFIKNWTAYEVDSPIAKIFETLRGKKLDKFEHYIAQAEKYDFFDSKDTDFYQAMHSLRKKRNRIHIQNQESRKPYNEWEVFDERSKDLSEKILEKILNTMISKYPREEVFRGFVQDFELPWDRHFKV